MRVVKSRSLFVISSGGGNLSQRTEGFLLAAGMTMKTPILHRKGVRT